MSGTVGLPGGHGLDLTTLSVNTPLGTFPVSAGGQFEAQVFEGTDTEIGAETARGELVLLGMTRGDAASLTLGTTAEALLYYAVGGMWLPHEQQDTLRSLLSNAAEVAALEAQLRRQLLAAGNGVAAPDQDTLDALAAVHASLIGDAQLSALWSGATGTGATWPLQSDPGPDGNIIIEPASTRRAGVEVLHAPSGAGIVAQNHFRRPAALLVYETGWEDADGELHENTPPVPIATVDIPATGQLEFFEALLDIVTADSPWSPVLSESASLPDHVGARRTRFQVVVVGPSATDDTLPIMADPRFDIFHGHWENIEDEKMLELFLDELLLPMVEVFGLGARAHFDASKLNELRRTMRMIHNEHLSGLGVLLKNRQSGLSNALKYAIQEMINNRNLRVDLLEAVGRALKASETNKLMVDIAEKRLAARAGASAIAAAVETLLVGGDVTKMVMDLSNAPSVVDWTAVSAPALFVLLPRESKVSKYYPSVQLSVQPRGASAGNYLYRWTTTGDHGSLSDLLNDGRTLTTTDPEIWYFHDSPSTIRDTHEDTVTVEVFEVEPGVTSVPDGLTPIARMSATVQGEDRELPGGLTVLYGSTLAYPEHEIDPYPCAAMYLPVTRVPGATGYQIRFSGISTEPHHPMNTNESLRHARITDYSIGYSANNGYTWPGACTFIDNVGRPTNRRPTDFVWFQTGGGYMLNVFTIVDSLSSQGGGPFTVGDAARQWVEWFRGATVTITPEFGR